MPKDIDDELMRNQILKYLGEHGFWLQNVSRSRNSVWTTMSLLRNSGRWRIGSSRKC